MFYLISKLFICHRSKGVHNIEFTMTTQNIFELEKSVCIRNGEVAHCPKFRAYHRNNAHEFIYICVHKSWTLWMKYMDVVKVRSKHPGAVDFDWKLLWQSRERLNEWKQFKGSDNICISGRLNKLWCVFWFQKKFVNWGFFYSFFVWGAVACFNGVSKNSTMMSFNKLELR